MATVDTIAEERAALRDLFRDITDLAILYDHEPREIADFPALTVVWTGFDPPEAATFRHAKQLRNYFVRVYISMDDWHIAQDKAADLGTRVWEKLIAMQRLDDSSNVIIGEVGATTIHEHTQDVPRPFIEVRIAVQVQHRSNYC